MESARFGPNSLVGINDKRNMGVVHKRSTDDIILEGTPFKGDFLEEVRHSLAQLRRLIRQEIEDCAWQCPVHDRVSADNDCEECNDALDMNVIINNVLKIPSLNENENTKSPV